jgi:hypothetical protein
VRHCLDLPTSGRPAGAQIYTASLDGCINLWQYETAHIESTWRVAHAIESMVLPSRHTAVLSVHWSTRKTARLIVLDLAHASEASVAEPVDGQQEAPVQRTAPGEARVCKLQQAGKLELSPDKNFVATVDGQRVLVLCLQHDRTVLTMLLTRGVTVRTARDQHKGLLERNEGSCLLHFNAPALTGGVQLQ